MYELDPPSAKGTLENVSFWWHVGSFWYNLCLLDSVLSNGGTFWYTNTKSWKWWGYFLFKCWYGFMGYDIFLAFYSQVWCI